MQERKKKQGFFKNIQWGFLSILILDSKFNSRILILKWIISYREWRMTAWISFDQNRNDKKLYFFVMNIINLLQLSEVQLYQKCRCIAICHHSWHVDQW